MIIDYLEIAAVTSLLRNDGTGAFHKEMDYEKNGYGVF